jgi:hypothetical protein
MIEYDFLVEDSPKTGAPIVTIQAHYFVNEWRQWKIHGKTAERLERDLICAELTFLDRDRLWDEWNRILMVHDKGDE